MLFLGFPQQQYYYNDDDVERVHVPVNYDAQRSSLPLSKAQLDKWFSVEQRSKISLPKYIIKNEIEYGPQRSDSCWYFNGGIAVHEPVEWIPCVHLVKQFPPSALEKEVTIKESETEQSELWAGASASLSLSVSASYFGVQVAAEAKVEGGVKTKRETSKIMEVKEHGKIAPGTPCYEVMVGMILKTKKVRTFYLKPDDVYCTTYNDNILTWGHGESWAFGDVYVSDYSFGRNEVKGMRFYDQGTYIQALPVLNNEKLTGMHIVFSFVNWVDWYAYTRAEDKHEAGEASYQAYPAWEPMSTLLALEK